jgi:hypothetical protein
MAGSSICTVSAHQLVRSCRIYHDKVSSDHFPLSSKVNINCEYLINDNSSSQHINSTYRIQWDKLTKEQVEKYSSSTECFLNAIQYSSTLASCTNHKCQLQEHVTGIDKLYEDICDALHSASKDLLVLSAHREYQIPGWNDYCKDLHTQARNAFLLWRVHGSPKQGPIFETMKKTRSHFKLSLRQSKNAKVQKNMDLLTQKFLTKDSKSFWKDIRTISGTDNQNSGTTIAGSTGHSNICDMWYSFYKDLLNSSTDTSKKDYVHQRLAESCPCDQFTISDIETAIRGLKKDTSPGMDGLASEHLIYAHAKIYSSLSVLFNCMVTHSYLPKKFMSTMLIPI